MRKLKFDLFKTFIIILLFGFLFVFYQYSQNGRFVSMNNKIYYKTLVIDTRTGTIYQYDKSNNRLTCDDKVLIKKD